MTTFNLVMLKCPRCGALMTTYDLMSYTVHRSESWSDGKTGAGMPASKNILICAVCREVFWTDDARLPEDPDWPADDSVASALDLYDLEWKFDDGSDEKTIDFYNNLLDNGFADEDVKEYYVRTRIWWSINNLIRHLSTWKSARNLGMLRKIIKHRRKTKALFKHYSALFDKNLDRLIFLLIKSADVDMLYLANMYRERGDFNKAKEILEKVEDKSKTWTKIKKKVERKDRMVIRL